MDVKQEKKRIKALLQDVAKQYRMPTVKLRYLSDHRVADCFGMTEQDGQMYVITLNATMPESWYTTVVHEIAHVVHDEMMKAGLTSDTQAHGPMFFALYAELYQKFIED